MNTWFNQLLDKLSQYLPRDKILHLLLGTFWLLILLSSWIVYTFLGAGAWVAYMGTTYSILYEVDQWYRKDGEPSILDAVATAIPSWIVGTIIYWKF